MPKYKVIFNPFTSDLDFVSTDTGHTVLTDIPVDPTVGVGDWVRMESGVAVRALADSRVHANVIGVCEFKAGAAIGNIRVLGVTDSIFAGLDETLEYYLSDVNPGKMVTVPPSASGTVVIKVGQPYDATKFLVLKGIRFVKS